MQDSSYSQTQTPRQMSRAQSPVSLFGSDSSVTPSVPGVARRRSPSPSSSEAPSLPSLPDTQLTAVSIQMKKRRSRAGEVSNNTGSTAEPVSKRQRSSPACTSTPSQESPIGNESSRRFPLITEPEMVLAVPIPMDVAPRDVDSYYCTLDCRFGPVCT